MDKDERFAEVMSTLRACLISRKGGISILTLNSEYRSLVGGSIPFKSFGFNSIEDFLRKVDGINLVKKGQELVVVAKPSASSEHIAMMISKQRTATKSKGRQHPVYASRPYKPYYSSSQANNSYFRKTSQTCHAPIKAEPNTHKITINNSKVIRPREVYAHARTVQPSNWDHSPPLPPSPPMPPKVPTKLDQQSSKTRPQAANYSPLDLGPSHLSTTPVEHKGGLKTNVQPKSRIVSAIGHTDVTPQPHLAPLHSSNPQRITTSSNLQHSTTPSSNYPQDSTHINSNNSSRCTTPISSNPQRSTTPKSADSQRSNSPALSMTQTSSYHSQKTGNAQISVSTKKKPSPNSTKKKQSPNSTKGDKGAQGSMGDDKQLLIDYALKYHKKEPLFKTVSIVLRGSKKFLCSVEIGNLKVTDPQLRENTPEAAENKMAKLMLEKLMALSCETQLHIQETKDENTIISRLQVLLAAKPHGFWTCDFPSTYSIEYKERLPSDWLNIVEGSDLFELTSVDSDKVILQLSSEVIIPPLIYPVDDNFWEVHVSSVYNTSEVWVRIIGEEYSDKLFTIIQEMSSMKDTPRFGLSKVSVGQVVMAIQDNSVFRAKVLEWSEGQPTAKCLLPDFGQADNVPLKDLARILPKFSKLPFQAVKCKLFGLEDFKDEVSVTHMIMNELFDKTYVARIALNEVDDADVPLIELFDTRTEEDININEEILEKIINHILFPVLPKGMMVASAVVSHVTDNCSVMVQPHPIVVQWLEKQTEKLLPLMLLQEPVPQFEDTEEMYLAMWNKNEDKNNNSYNDEGDNNLKPLLCRVIVKKLLVQNLAEIYFVDYGRTGFVDTSLLRKLNHLLDVPYQAIQCNLRNVPPVGKLKLVCSERTTQRLRELVPSGTRVILRTIIPASDSPAQVQIFCRKKIDNSLVSIHDTISMDERLFNVLM